MKPWPALAAAFLLASCASYRPLPLDTTAQPPDNPVDIRIDAAALSLPGLRHHIFDPNDGLDMTEVAILAVANNPQLKLARDDLGIARAQAFAAGLLPDPVLGAAREFPMNGSANSTAFNLGLSYDVTALLTHSTATRAAHDTAREVDLNLLWQEWQVVGAARQLFIRADYEKRALSLLAHEVALLEQLHQELAEASQRGDVSLNAVSDDTIRLQAVKDRLNALQREQVVTNQELNALLGLSPKAKLDLVGPSTIHTLNDTDVRRDLADLPRRRPDLLALEAGYRSQDERYRQAILRQFPSIDIGFDRSRDTSNVNTYGFDISISLPIFNRHRGVVAVEKATRQRLHDEYSARLFSARAEINRIQLDQTILERRRHQLEHVNATMSQTSQAAEAAHARGDLSDIAYLSRQAAWLDNSLALLGVNRYIQEQQVALRILVGSQPQTD